MNTQATIHYLRNGKIIATEQQSPSRLAPQQFAELIADLVASGARGFVDIDEVHVWFGELDGREPDATAQVPA